MSLNQLITLIGQDFQKIDPVKKLPANPFQALKTGPVSVTLGHPKVSKTTSRHTIKGFEALITVASLVLLSVSEPFGTHLVFVTSGPSFETLISDLVWILPLSKTLENLHVGTIILRLSFFVWKGQAKTDIVSHSSGSPICLCHLCLRSKLGQY